MSQSWYNNIALKNGGYKADVAFRRVGLSGEVVFEERLQNLLPTCQNVLDVGCGHGAFTLKMAPFAKHITGVDNAEELLRIANQLLDDSRHDNVDFTYMWTHGEIPFADHSFDLIYSRRGPMSILNHPNLLKKDGKIMGIHSFDLTLERLSQLIEKNGYKNLSVETYDTATVVFESDIDFAKFLSASHMNPDYTLDENKAAFEEIVQVHQEGNLIIWPEKRYIWTATCGDHIGEV